VATSGGKEEKKKPKPRRRRNNVDINTDMTPLPVRRASRNVPGTMSPLSAHGGAPNGGAPNVPKSLGLLVYGVTTP